MHGSWAISLSHPAFGTFFSIPSLPPSDAPLPVAWTSDAKPPTSRGYSGRANERLRAVGSVSLSPWAGNPGSLGCSRSGGVESGSSKEFGPSGLWRCVEHPTGIVSDHLQPVPSTRSGPLARLLGSTDGTRESCRQEAARRHALLVCAMAR